MRARYPAVICLFWPYTSSSAFLFLSVPGVLAPQAQRQDLPPHHLYLFPCLVLSSERQLSLLVYQWDLIIKFDSFFYFPLQRVRSLGFSRQSFQKLFYGLATTAHFQCQRKKGQV